MRKRAGLARALEREGVRSLGTSSDAIDLAEDRGKFEAITRELGVATPPSGVAQSVEEAVAVAARVGYPVLVRPSYVLGGRAMAIIHDQSALDEYLLGVWPSLVPSDTKARYPHAKTRQIHRVRGKNRLLFARSPAAARDSDAAAPSARATGAVRASIEGTAIPVMVVERTTSTSDGSRWARCSAPFKASAPSWTACSMNRSFDSPKPVSVPYCSSGSTRCRLLTRALACSRDRSALLSSGLRHTSLKAAVSSACV